MTKRERELLIEAVAFYLDEQSFPMSGPDMELREEYKALHRKLKESD